MNNIEKSQDKNGRLKRLLDSRAFSAAWGRVLGLALLALSAMPSYAAKSSKPPNYSPDLAAWVKASTNGMVTVNIQFKTYPTSGYLKGRVSAGATLRWKLPTIKAVNMTVPVSMLKTLENQANVVYISPDRPLNLMSNPATEEFATAVEAD